MDFNTIKNWVATKYPKHDNSKITMIAGAIMAYLNAHPQQKEQTQKKEGLQPEKLSTKVESFQEKTGIPYKDALKKGQISNKQGLQQKPKKVFVTDLEKIFYIFFGSLVILGILTKIFNLFS